jgi:chorismate mutase/prephenate dehydrogenase
MDSESVLKKLRGEIGEIDEALLGLFARRQGVSRRIAEAKLAAGLPIKDPRLEKSRIEEGRRRARELDVYEDAAEELTQLLIKYSCRLQEEYLGRARARTSGSRRSIAIAGGQGLMGRWLAQFFDGCGHAVSLLDTRPPVDDAFPAVASLEQAARADILVLSTPIGVTAAILEKLVPLKPRGLVFDVCSLKTPLLQAIGHARRSGMKITSVHPMFGPRTEWLAGRNILLCEAGNPEATDAAAELFGESSANLIRVALDQHDAYMGYVLGLSHLVNLVFGTTLQRGEFPYEKLRQIGSTTFFNQAQVAEPVASENADLYFEIQVENSATPGILTSLSAAFEAYDNAIRARDRAAFTRLMGAAREYFNRR